MLFRGWRAYWRLQGWDLCLLLCSTGGLGWGFVVLGWLTGRGNQPRGRRGRRAAAPSAVGGFVELRGCGAGAEGDDARVEVGDKRDVDADDAAVGKAAGVADAVT